MNGYYKAVLEILLKNGFKFHRNGKGSHEIYLKFDDNGKIIGRVQIPIHLNDKRMANILLKQANIKERL